MDPFLLSALVGAGFLAFALLLTVPTPDRKLAFLAGAAGGLVAAQVANVHVFTVLVTLWWLLTPHIPGRSHRAAWIPAVVLPIAVTAITGDLVNNPLVAVQYLALAINAAMIASRATSDSVGLFLRGLLVVCTAASLMGLGQVAGVVPSGAFHTELIAAGRPHAFYDEPDWLGLFATIGLVLAFRTLPKRTRTFYAVTLINVAASAVAVARASWVALGASILVYLLAAVLSKPRARSAARRGTFRAIAVIGAVGAAALVALPDIREALLSRVLSLLQPDTTVDVSGRARIQQTEGLRDLAATAPWYGHGASASGRVGVSGVYNPKSENSLGTNWLLALWVDAKYLAIPFALFVWTVALRTIATVSGQVVFLLAVHNLFSNATLQPVTWLMLGLAVASAPVGRTVDSLVVRNDADGATGQSADHHAGHAAGFPRTGSALRRVGSRAEPI